MAQFSVIHIDGGPSKFELMLALFDTSREAPRTLQFKRMLSSREYDVHITSVEREGDSCELWNIRAVVVPESTTTSRGRRVLIYYRTDNRKGHLKYLD